MSAFGGKADVNHCVGECPLIAISGHWWANENGGSGEPDRTPHLHNRKRLRERDWYSIRLAVHSGATSPGRKPMTTPKTTFAGLALIAALCAGFILGLTAPARWARRKRQAPRPEGSPRSRSRREPSTHWKGEPAQPVPPRDTCGSLEPRAAPLTKSREWHRRRWALRPRISGWRSWIIGSFSVRIFLRVLPY